MKLASSIVLVILMLALPSGLSTTFDGLPWTHPAETVSLMVVIPFLVICCRQFLVNKFSRLALVALVAAKIVLFVGSPNEGWEIKVYPTLADYYQSKWIETYSSLWHNDSSAVIVKPWLDKKNFPLEWAIPKISSSAAWSSRFDVKTAPNDYDDVRPVLTIAGSIRLLQPHDLVVIAEGLVDGSITLTNRAGEARTVDLLGTGNQKESKLFNAINGEWVVHGQLTYFGDNWSLIPLSIGRTGKQESLFESAELYQTTAALPSSMYFQVFQYLGMSFSIGVMLYLFIWGICSLHYLIGRGNLNWLVGGMSVAAICLPKFTEPLLDSIGIGTGVNLGSAPLGLGITLSGGCMLLVAMASTKIRKLVEGNTAVTAFIMFAPATFIFFLIRWWPDLEAVTLLSHGDDWTHYQLLAYRIAVWGEVVTGGGEKLFYYQPFYRYLVALFHGLFGKSFVAQQLFDVWSVIATATFVIVFLRRLGVSQINVYWATILYLVPVLIGPIRHHIGRGLSEHTSMLFLVCAVWILLASRKSSMTGPLVAAMFGVLGYWTRQDHLFMTAAAVCILVEPISGSVAVVWSKWLRLMLRNWKEIAGYSSIIVMGIVIILIRNWALSGELWLNSADHPNYVFVQRHDGGGEAIPIRWQPSYYLKKIQLMIAMKPFGSLPSPFSIAMIVGSLAAMLSLVYRPSYLRQMPLSLGLIFLGAFAPYYFVNNWGYAPRYSIHILPFATVAFIVLWDDLSQRMGKRIPVFQRFHS